MPLSYRDRFGARQLPLARRFPNHDHTAATGVERDDRYYHHPGVATQIHPPQVVFVMLCMLALASSLLAGYSMAGGQSSSHWIHMLVFAVIMALTVYVILDLEYPLRVDQGRSHRSSAGRPSR